MLGLLFLSGTDASSWEEELFIFDQGVAGNESSFFLLAVLVIVNRSLHVGGKSLYS